MALKPFVSVPRNEREWQRWLQDSHDLRVRFGAGSPEGVVTAGKGTLYLRTDGGATTTLYVKTDGDGLNTGWTAK